MAELRWVRRNEDKPHRCIECHGIALRAWEGRYAPRTVMSCPNACGVRWRVSVRTQRRPMRDRTWWQQNYPADYSEQKRSEKEARNRRMRVRRD